MSDSDDIQLSAKECQERIDRFVEITNTDEAFAQASLQDVDWNLDAAINAFLGQNMPAASNKASAELTTAPPKVLSFVSWNVDGMSETNLNRRIEAIAKTILDLRVDMAFFQEVVPSMLEKFEENLVEYHFIPQDDPGPYFTCIAIRSTTIYLDSENSAATIPFQNSQMGRGLQVVKAHCGEHRLTLMNTHLESTKDFAQARCRQLEQCKEKIQAESSGRSVIFGGDLNLRDKEVDQTGGIQKGVVDLWEHLGSKPECRYTWDASRNSNIEIPGGGRWAKCRFDRIYFRKAEDNPMTPATFNLIGIEKVKGTQRFPSDHWGIFCTFKLD